MNTELIVKIFLLVATSFMTVVLLVPFVKKIAINIDAIDIPNERKVHKHPIPRLGGVAMFLGFLFGYMLYGETSSIMNSILIGSFIVVLTGVVDDIKPLKNSTKFFGQFLSAAVIAFYGGILIKDISAFGIYMHFGIFSYPLTIFFILGCIN